MTRTQLKKTGAADRALIKPDPSAPALIMLDRRAIAVRAGVTFRRRVFSRRIKLPTPAAGFTPGADYGVIATAKELAIEKLETAPAPGKYLGGFHFAPGGNAPAATASRRSIPVRCRTAISGRPVPIRAA